MDTDPNDPYVETRDGNVYLRGSRVTLETVILNWRNKGRMPQDIQKSFPSVSLAAIYGTIAYYLAHQDEADRFLADNQAQYAAQRAAAQAANPEWYARMRQRFAEAQARMAASEDTEAHESATP